MNSSHKYFAGLLAVVLWAAAPVSAVADTTVTLTFGTPPSGQGNSFTVICGVSPAVTLATYDLNLYYDSAKVSHANNAIQDLAGFAAAWSYVSDYGGTDYGTSDQAANCFYYSGSSVSNVSAIFRATFTQLQADSSGIYIYVNNYPGLDGLWEDNHGNVPIPHSFAADYKYLPVSVSAFAVD